MLSENQRQLIRERFAKGESKSAISRDLRVSRTTIGKVINKGVYKTGKPLGRPRKLNVHHEVAMKRHLRREITKNALVNSRRVKEALDLPAARSTVRRKMKELGFNYEVLEPQLPFTKKHKSARLAFAEERIKNQLDWKTVIFSDEKRFKKDGPDGLASYVDTNEGAHKTKPLRIKRQAGGGGIMVLGAMASTGNIKLLRIDGKYTASRYLADLQTEFIPWSKKQFPRRSWMWQQDNASIHTAKIVKSYLSKFNTLVWPARSPDLSIIENVWHLLELEVYSQGQFNSDNKLWLAIQKAAKKIFKATISALYTSLPSRMLKVVQSKGEQIQ